MTFKELNKITLLLNSMQSNTTLFEYYSVQKLEKEVNALKRKNDRDLQELMKTRKENLISFINEFAPSKIPNPYRDEETTNPIINPD
jgi:hypothetical protein